jgi:hypothetical protein
MLLLSHGTMPNLHGVMHTWYSRCHGTWGLTHALFMVQWYLAVSQLKWVMEHSVQSYGQHLDTTHGTMYIGKCKDMDKSVSVCIRIREGYIRGYKILILVSADTSIRGRDGFPTDFDGFYGFPTDIPTDISADYPSHFLQSYCCTIH